MRGLPYRFATKMWYYFHIPPMLVTCHFPLVCLKLLTRIIFGEEYKLWSSFAFFGTCVVCGYLYLLLYQAVINCVTGQGFRNKILKVENEHLLAEQEHSRLRKLLDQERNKVSNDHLMLD
jgi:hypothetical protein